MALEKKNDQLKKYQFTGNETVAKLNEQVQ